MSNDIGPSGGKLHREDIKELSNKATRKGIGNSEFGMLHEIAVRVSPSVICEAYARELHDSMLQTIILSSGNPDAVLPFSFQDLNVYLTILLRERIHGVRKERVLFSPSDQDVKIPHFFFLALYELGDVVDEVRHVSITAHFDDTDLARVHERWEAIWPREESGRLVPENKWDAAMRTTHVAALKQWKSLFTVYEGEAGERDFVYSMSQKLKMLERIGFANGSALPRGLTGELSFMLFMWAEHQLRHVDPGVEPGQALLASLLAFSRNTTLLNPYISYGPEQAYRVLLKEVTTPRGKAS